MSHFSKSTQVCHLQLWIGNDFQKYATGIIIYHLFYLFYICEIYQMCLHTKTAQSTKQQGKGIAEKMLGGDDILTLRSQCQHGIADGSHTGVESSGMRGTRKCSHTTLQIGYRRVFYTRIIWCLDLVCKGIRHDLRIIKFVCQCIIYWHTQRIISISALIGHMDGLCLFLHLI